MKTTLESPSGLPGQIGSFWVLGARLTWVAVGPLALLGIVYGIVSAGTGWWTGLDAAFAVFAVLILLGRWVEYRSGTATSLHGEPTTPAQFRRYMLVVPALVLVAWLVANLLGNHVLK